MKVTIQVGDSTETHISHTACSYITLCGLDGHDGNWLDIDDESDINYQRVKETEKFIDCAVCHEMWLTCKSIKKKDFKI